MTGEVRRPGEPPLAAGDRDGARRAWQRYRALRAGSDGRFAVKSEEVRRSIVGL